MSMNAANGSLRRKPRSGARGQRRLAIGHPDPLECRIAPVGDFSYALGIGSTGVDVGTSIVRDGGGHVYVAGTFQGTVDFDPGPGVTNLTSAGPPGTSNVFVARFDVNGNLLWAVAMGGNSGSDAKAITVDAYGGVYVTGSFQGTADLDPSANTLNFTSHGGRDIFVTKLTNSGGLVWSKTMGGTGDDVAEAIDADFGSTPNVFITGSFSGTASFDPNAYPGASHTATGAGANAFVEELDGSGAQVWTRTFGSSAGTFGKGITVNRLTGSIATTGTFQGSAEFDTGTGSTILTAPAGKSNAYVQHLDLNGNFLWARALGGSSTLGTEATAITFDEQSGIYITGRFRGPSDFDPGAGVFTLNDSGGYDGFVAMLNTSGAFSWAARTPSASSGDDSAHAVALGPGTVTVAGSTATGAGGDDAFVSQYDRAGAPLWTKLFGGTGTAQGLGVAVDPAGNVFSTGAYQGADADFDPDPTKQALLTATGPLPDTNVFVSRLRPTPNNAPVAQDASLISFKDSTLVDGQQWPGLVLGYDFDEATSGTTPAFDGGMGPPLEGRFLGQAGRTPNTLGSTYPTGGALDLTPGGAVSNEVASAPDAKVDNLAKFTVTLWINVQSAPSDQDWIIGDRPGLDADGSGWGLRIRSPLSGTISASNFGVTIENYANDNTTRRATGSAPGTINADHKWVFLALTMDTTGGVVSTLYRGDETTAATPSSQLLLRILNHGNNSPLEIGGTTSDGAGVDRTPPAWIDNVQIFDSMLSPADIEFVRQSGLHYTGLLNGGVLRFASDPDGDPLTAQLVSGPQHGTVDLFSNGAYAYTPAPGYHGPDSFKYRVSDGMLFSNVATISFEMDAMPVASNASVTVPIDTATPIVLSATDADGDPLNYRINAAPQHGTLTGTAPNVTYTPATGYNGPDSFSFYADDGRLVSNIAVISITVVGTATTTTVTATPNATYGQSVSFTAIVTKNAASPPPLNGSVQFFVDGNPTGGSVALAGGVANSAPVAGLAAGSHAVKAVFTSGDMNYAGSTGVLVGGLNVAKAPLTVTADSKSKTYGASNPALTVSYAGFVNGDTTSSLSTTPTVSTTATAASHAGSYAITAAGAASSNYAITYVDGTLTVNAAPLTITADNQTATYGGAVPPLTQSASGFVNGDTLASLVAQPVLTTAPASSHAGTYAITASGASSPDYAITYAAGTLTITPASLTITAADRTVAYGTTPVLTATYAGLVNGDSPASIDTPPSLTTVATPSSDVGSYAITASGAADPDYTIAYAPGVLNIIAAPLTITVNDQTRPFGQANPPFSTRFDGFVLGQGPSSLAGTLAFNTTATQGSPAGTYQVTASGLTATNYAITYVPGTLTIDPPSGALATTVTLASTLTAPRYGQSLSFTAAVSAVGSGLPVPSGSVQFVVDGSNFGSPVALVNGSASSLALATLGAGTHTIDANYSGDVAFSSNHAASLALVVARAPLSVTADNKSRAYGQADPQLTASISGFVLGQDASSLGGALAFSTTATPGSHVGSYPLTPSGLTSNNYLISFVSGTLTVTPAALYIAAVSTAKTFGAPVPALSVTYNGLVNGDQPSSLNTAPNVATSALAGSNVGDYPITVSGASDPDYTITYTPGTLTIVPAALTVTAAGVSKVYGQSNPALSATFAGFVAGDGPGSLGGTLGFSTTATASSHVGSYPVTPGGVTSNNYDISFVPGQLLVTPAPLSITADTKSKPYGAALPALTATYSGFAAGDNASNLVTQPTLATTATAASDVGSYPITVTGASSPDYDITAVAGTLDVTAVPLTVTVNDATKVYGQANPQFTATMTGFVLGQGPAVLGGALTFSTAATAASHVGVYGVGGAGLLSGNYAINYVDGLMTITPAPLTVKADDLSTTYGAPLPALSTSYSGFVNGDTPASLSQQPVLATGATSASDVGVYPISVTGSALADYTITPVAGTLTVTPAPLSVTVNDAARVYGAPNPQFTASIDGFVLGQGAGVLGGALAFQTAATAASHVGEYVVAADGLSSTNYSISYVDGRLTITPAPLVISANNVSKLFGAALPELTASFTGFVNGDTAASLATPPTLSTTAAASSRAGTYPIIAFGAASLDYAISYVAGTLTIRPAVSGDYNGDGRTDLSLFYRKPKSGQGSWFIPNVTSPSGTPFGSSTKDIPVQGDFNGDGRTDIALYRPSTSQWFVAGGAQPIKYGPAKLGIPVPGRYDGSSVTQLAVFVPGKGPNTGAWYIGGRAKPVKFGGAGDIPVPADYDGDGKTDIAVYRPRTGQWIVQGHSPVKFGGANDIPVPGDYDGVGHDEMAVYHPSSAQWFVAGSTQYSGVHFGSAGAVPVPGDYDGVGHTQVAVYYASGHSAGKWVIAGHGAAQSYGGVHLVPASAPLAYRTIGGKLSIKVERPSTTRTVSTAAIRTVNVKGTARPAQQLVTHPTGPSWRRSS